MKNMVLVTSLLSFSVISTAAPITTKSTQQDQLGYSYGYVMGRSNAETLKDINLDAFIQGIKEGSNGQKATLTDEEILQLGNSLMTTLPTGWNHPVIK